MERKKEETGEFSRFSCFFFTFLFGSSIITVFFFSFFLLCSVKMWPSTTTFYFSFSQGNKMGAQKSTPSPFPFPTNQKTICCILGMFLAVLIPNGRKNKRPKSLLSSWVDFHFCRVLLDMRIADKRESERWFFFPSLFFSVERQRKKRNLVLNYHHCFPIVCLDWFHHRHLHNNTFL